MKRISVRRLLRKHKSECVQQLNGILMFEDTPYDHNMTQLIEAIKMDISLIDKIFLTIESDKLK